MEIAGVSWREFKLSDSFINAYHGKQPNWGPLGYVTFLRTYSRYLDEAGEMKEEFWQTLQRVVEGTFNLQKYHCHTFNIPWNQSKAMARAERMYDKMWRFQFLPSGRGLWLMGTDFMRKHGSAGLNSCAFTTTENIHKFPVDPFTWAMEISMLGVGVGFDTRGAARLRVQAPSGTKDVVIEDSREGWVASLEVLLEAFFTGKALPKFDYSQIRPRGQLLKQFGGRSSGPDPLINMHQGLIEVLSPRIGEKLTSVDIVDIFTNIGKCVVSGNIRRSAMIALGDVEDEEFKNLKLDQAKMMSNRWASNNSVFGYHGMDYRDIVERCSVNGEPGIVWLDNVRGYGRLADGYTGIDNRVMGVNPCGEQAMEPDELCNLIETFPVNHSSMSEYKETLEDALLYGKSVTLLNTKWPRTNGVMSRNRRMGISQTGIIEFLGKVGLPEARVWCEEGYQHLREEDSSVSQFLCIRESIKLTSVKPSGCRPWYALTSTDRGLLTLEELFEDHPEDAVWADMLQPTRVLQGGSTDRVTKTYSNGVSPIHQLTMSYGLSVESSPEHLWCVIGEVREKSVWNPVTRECSRRVLYDTPRWVKTSEVPVGAILDVHVGVYHREEHAKLQTLDSLALKMRGDSVPIQQPEYMSEDLAWLLGYLWGDGCMSPAKWRLRWVDGRLENLEKTKDILQRVFHLGDLVTIRKLEDRAAWTLEVGSKYLWHWFVKNGLMKYDADALDLIPTVIRQSSWEDIVAFVAGLLDADGCVSLVLGAGKVSISTADTRFAQHLQDVCWAVGLGFGRSLQERGQSFQQRRHLWHLMLGKCVLPEVFAVLQKHSTKIARFVSDHPEVSWHHLNQKSDRHLYVGKVLRNEVVREEATYDIEVGDSHWFYAGAVKSHNSISLLPGVSPGIHYPHSEYYIRRMRLASDSTLLPMLRDAGYPMEPDVKEPGMTTVVEFPIRSYPFVRGKESVPVWQQLENAAFYQHYWSDNNVSITVTFNEDEKEDLIQALPYYERRLKVVSMLMNRSGAYQQAPYEEISAEEYERRVQAVQEIDYGRGGSDQAVGEMYCTNDTCSLHSEQ